MTGGKIFFLKLAVIAAASLVATASPAQNRGARSYLQRPDVWFGSAEARRFADNVLTWQSPAGSWPKNQSTTSEPFRGDTSQLQGTFDNGATTGEIRFLARAFRAGKDERYQRAALRGVDHILRAQYPNGGWPQYAPPPAQGYPRHITFNDELMVRLMELLRLVAKSDEFDFVGAERRNTAQSAFERGIQCILKCQIAVNGKLTVWCAQHDEQDFSPRPARKYELVSLSGQESTGILRLLMSLEQPGPEVVRAVRAGAEWFESAKLTGIRQSRDSTNTVIVADRNAPPLWARFYEIETSRPMFCGRDGVRKYNFADIEAERRNGYAWYGSWGEQVAADYAGWSKKWLKPATKTR